MSAPTATRPRIIERSSGLYAHEPATDPDHPANVGRCIAFARRRLADMRWEICWVGTRAPVSVHRTRQAAHEALAELTGAVV